jgi:hypothetical protein
MNSRVASVNNSKAQGPDEESLLPLTKNAYPLEVDGDSSTKESPALATSAPTSWYDGARRRVVQLLALTAFLILWEANVEVLQGITTGGPNLGMKSQPYDKPVFITWYSYNYLTLSLLFVTTFLTASNQRLQLSKNAANTNLQHSKNAAILRDKTVNFTGSLLHYVRFTWPGRLGFQRAMLSCLLISWLLQFLNVLMIVGLKCISVILSNALYQFQAVFTLGLSVGLLKDPLTASQVAGVLVSMVGITWIVTPSLLAPTIGEVAEGGDNQLDNRDGTCGSLSFPVLWGSVVTLLSAIIGGFYLVAWRIFDENRDRSTSTSQNATMRLDILVDTQMTLAMIGFCNLLAGWPLVVMAHVSGFESFQWPEAATASGEASVVVWKLMVLNSIVQFLFDVSIVIAVYVTSPLTVAVVSPLTIPLSMVMDRYAAHYKMELQNEADYTPMSTPSGNGNFDVVSSVGGTVVILIGVWLMEAKPQLLG